MYMINGKSENTIHKALVDLYQKGDKDALKLLIKQFHPKLKKAVLYHTGNRECVDDLVQECWISIIKRLDTLELKISFEAWALTIARRKSIDWIRKQQRLRKQKGILKTEAEFDTDDTEVIKDEDLIEKIHLGIQQISPTQRIVLNMFYLENLNLREICSVLNVSEGTVKSRLFYARENLKKIITQQTEE